MKSNYLIIALILISACINAQEAVHQIHEVSVVNYGDSRLLFREINENKTPLQGEHRIIDGYKSEYIVATFKDGMFHGKYKYFKNNILREIADYKQGYKTGSNKKYNFQGVIVSAGDYTKGKLDGIFTCYFQDGQIETQQAFKMGVEHGFCHRYNRETGKISQESFYKHGKNDSTWVKHYWSSRGSYTEYSKYKDGIQIGEYLRIADNDTCLLKGFYTNGEKDGLWEYRREDGTPRKMVTYRNGKKEGDYQYYYEDGTLKEKGVCENDIIVKCTKYKANGRRIRD